MIAEDVATLLQSAGVGTYSPHGAWPIFINFMPDSPDGVLVLTETGGFPDQDDFTDGMDVPTVQVRVRAAVDSPRDAHVKARAAYDALHRLSNRTLASGAVLIEAAAQQPPASMGRDANRRLEYVFNVALRVQATRQNYGG